MTDRFALFQCLHPHLTPTTLRPLSRMVSTMLMLTGGSRGWVSPAGRARAAVTVQRVFSQALPWAMLFGMFCRQPVYRPGEVYLLAGDEVVVTQAGKHTDGLDRFFASLYSQVVPALAVFALSWVSVQERRSCPSRVEPIVRSAAENAVSKAKAEAQQPPPSTTRRGPGHPKGRQTQATAAVTLTPEVVRIRHLRKALLHLIPRRFRCPICGSMGTVATPTPCTWPHRAVCRASPRDALTRLYLCPTKARMLGVAHVARMAANWMTATSRLWISTPPPSQAPSRPASTKPHGSTKRSRTR